MYTTCTSIHLTRSIRDSETSIDFVQGPPGSRRERVKHYRQWLTLDPGGGGGGGGFINGAGQILPPKMLLF